MNDLVDPTNSSARIPAGLRRAVAVVVPVCVIAALYLMLFKDWPGANTRTKDISSPGATRFPSEAYVDRWIAVDLINRPDAEPFDITELMITGEKGSLAVEIRGQKVDEVHNGNWSQKPCPSGCVLGIAYATLEGDALVTSIETAPGLTHQLTLKVKAPTPGSDALLTVEDTVMFGSEALASSTHEFISHSLIHPERMMDTGLAKLR